MKDQLNKTQLVSHGLPVEGTTLVTIMLISHRYGGVRMSEVKSEVKCEAGLSAVCGVCSSPAAAHQHYGAVCCYSCRAFFRRGVGRIYNCVRGDGRCEVNKINRTNCRKCRFDTCLMVGMRPELVDATLKSRLREPSSPRVMRSPESDQRLVTDQRPITVSQQANVVNLSSVRTSCSVPFSSQMFLPEVRRMPHTSMPRILTDSVLLQALEGKRKVVLEPRNPCPTIVPTIATNKLIDLSKIAQSNKLNELSTIAASNHLLDLSNHKTPVNENLVTQSQIDEEDEIIYREPEVIFPEENVYYAPAHLVPYQDQFQVIKEETVMAEDLTEQEYQLQEQVCEEPMKMEQIYYEEHAESTQNTYFREELPMEVTVIRPTPCQRRVHLENKYSTVQRYRPESSLESLPKVQINEFLESHRYITECSKESLPSQRYVADCSKESFQSLRYIPEYSNESFPSQRYVSECSKESFQPQKYIPEYSKESFPSQRYVPECSKESFQSQIYIPEYSKESFPPQRCVPKFTEESFSSTRVNIMKDTLRCVNIEDLVDSCFEEEFQKESNAEEKKVEPTSHNDTNKFEEENINNGEENEHKREETIVSKEETSTLTEHMGTEEDTQLYNLDNTIKLKENNFNKPKASAKHLKKRRSSASPPLPFKKRRRNPELIYPVSLAVNRRNIPVMDFTLEEEFRLYDLMVRREHLHQKEFKACLDIGTPLAMKRCIRDIVDNTKINQKIRIDEQFFDRWLGCVKDVYITHARSTFQEFSKISSSKCISMFSSTYPAALACCMAYYFHGANFNSYIEQEKFAGRWGGDTSEWFLENIPDIREVRRVRMDDFSLFTSPWATTTKKEIFFEKSLKTIGELIGGDEKLATIFMLLLMMSPKEEAQARDEQHRDAQNDVRFLMYRYLKSKPGYDHDKANKMAHRIEGMIKALHKCGNIFINKRLKSIESSDTFTELM